ncbi:N-ATPase subunit AtpR [Celerinatantimonas yamalensis]|uniref:ATP synthase subunit I n=1 Tax=Celerinatantimonas yamalensis TaxID=559956 RepID=A0ABW9G6K3_9GAMM
MSIYDINWLQAGLALLAGGILGAIFFGGLWWTVQHGATSTTPARWFISSFIVRTGITLFGFYAVGAGQLLQLGCCLLGFMLARAITLRWRLPPKTQHTPARLNKNGEPPCA